MKMRVFATFIVLTLLLSACRSTKFVPEGEFLLDKVHIKTDNNELKQSELKLFIRQTPNAAIFSVIRMQLGVYNIAGKDSSKWYNRMWMRMGDKPVIYNPMLTSLSVQQLQKSLENKGYLHSKVESNVSFNGKKAVVNYDVKSNKPYTLRDYSLNLKNVPLTEIAADTARSLIRTKMLFDTDILNAERERITSRFRQVGYYNFTKDFLTYTVDSTLNTHQVDVNLELRDFLKKSN